MIQSVEYPLTGIPDPALSILAEAGKSSAVDALQQQARTLMTVADDALAQANALLNDGYTLIFRERVATAEGESLVLFFHKMPAPLESIEQTVIKEAIRAYNTPPVKDYTEGEAQHPDTLRLRAVMEALFKAGIYPDEPVADATQKIAVVNLEEVAF